MQGEMKYHPKVQLRILLKWNWINYPKIYLGE